MLICSIDFILSFLTVLIILKYLFHGNCYNTKMVIILLLLPIFFIKIHNFKKGHLISKFHAVYTHFDFVLRPAFWLLWRSSFDHERQSGHNQILSLYLYHKTSSHKISCTWTCNLFLLRFNSSKIHFFKEIGRIH